MVPVTLCAHLSATITPESARSVNSKGKASLPHHPNSMTVILVGRGLCGPHLGLDGCTGRACASQAKQNQGCWDLSLKGTIKQCWG